MDVNNNNKKTSTTATILQNTTNDCLFIYYTGQKHNKERDSSVYANNRERETKRGNMQEK